MKKIAIILLLPALLALSGCGDATGKGQAAAEQLRAAWGDTTAVAQFVTRYAAQRDSLSMPGAAGAMDDAFIGAFTGNDTLHVAAMLIALSDEDFAARQGKPLVDALRDGVHTAQTAADHLALVHSLAASLHMPAKAAAMDAAIDREAQSLSLNDQMALYARSCAPAALAAAMRDDLKTGAVTPEAHKQRVEALRAIYTPEQWRDFAAALGIDE